MYNLNKKLFNKESDTLGLANTYFIFQYKSENINEPALQAVDVDDILRQCKDKAIQLMNKQYTEDEYHMFAKGVQAMYLAVENIVKEGGLDE